MIDTHTDSAPTNRNLPDRIADELVIRIITGELVPGSVLPAERTLATELQVDRTSLRMALRQLSRMKLLRSVRGSGITVLDYRRTAGLDFLAMVLEVPGLDLGGMFLLEALDHYEACMPAVTVSAFARATPSDIRDLDRLFAEQLRVLDSHGDLDELQEIELDIQDAIIDMVGSTTMRLIANSSRGLRRKLGRKAMDMVDPRQQVLTQRAAVRSVLSVGGAPRGMAHTHRRFMEENNSALRDHLTTLEPGPRRLADWSKEAK